MDRRRRHNLRVVQTGGKPRLFEGFRLRSYGPDGLASPGALYDSEVFRKLEVKIGWKLGGIVFTSWIL